MDDKWISIGTHNRARLLAIEERLCRLFDFDILDNLLAVVIVARHSISELEVPEVGWR